MLSAQTDARWPELARVGHGAASRELRPWILSGTSTTRIVRRTSRTGRSPAGQCPGTSLAARDRACPGTRTGSSASSLRRLIPMAWTMVARLRSLAALPPRRHRRGDLGSTSGAWCLEVARPVAQMRSRCRWAQRGANCPTDCSGSACQSIVTPTHTNAVHGRRIDLALRADARVLIPVLRPALRRHVPRQRGPRPVAAQRYLVRGDCILRQTELDVSGADPEHHPVLQVTGGQVRPGRHVMHVQVDRVAAAYGQPTGSPMWTFG